MAKVVDIGGVFFKARDSKALASWYRDRLHMEIKPWGGATFAHDRPEQPGKSVDTVWALFGEDTKYFAPSEKPFMINLRVDDLAGMLAELRKAGATVLDRGEDGENGKFGYVVDPEGNLVELWQAREDEPDPGKK